MKSKVFGSYKGKIYYHKRTICEVHRQMYDVIELNIGKGEIKDKLVRLLEEAFQLGVKMGDKLREHHDEQEKWVDDNGSDGLMDRMKRNKMSGW